MFLYEKIIAIIDDFITANDIVFIIMLIINIRLYNDIIETSLADYASNNKIYYFDQDELDMGVLTYVIKKNNFMKLIKFIKTNIDLINKIISENIPKDILPPITLQ